MKKQIEHGPIHKGASGGWEIVFDWDLGRIVEKEVEILSKILRERREPPKGFIDCVIGINITGIASHENCGHPSEADRILGREGAQAGESFLNREMWGQRIVSEEVTIVDDPTLEGSFGFYLFDDEGAPTQKTMIIERGVLKGFIHNTSTAKRYNAKTTGNAGIISRRSSNLVFEPGDYSFEELLSETGDNPMLYITSSRYTRFTNRVEGTFSSIPRDGVFLIKNGELWKPVRGLRISDNMLNIFKNTVGLSKERQQVKWWEVTTPTVSPFFLVRNCLMTRATQ